MVQSPIGKKQLDSRGSLVGAARMDPAKGYAPVPNVEETDDPNLIFTPPALTAKRSGGS